MAIVAEKISGLGGEVSVTSNPGRGTTFVIALPITISNFRGILVQVSDHSFIVPTISVERAIRLTKARSHNLAAASNSRTDYSRTSVSRRHAPKFRTRTRRKSSTPMARLQRSRSSISLSRPLIHRLKPQVRAPMLRRPRRPRAQHLHSPFRSLKTNLQTRKLRC